MFKEFLDLGRQPIANAFLKEEDFKDEFFFDLKVGLDTDTNLVSIKNFVEPERIFNEDYPYNTSNSFPMIQHFKDTAKMLYHDYNKPKKVLEIGSNSGPFIDNFSKVDSICVEPCSNFAEVTEGMGYKTYIEFWTTELAKEIVSKDGYMDMIYAANCMCHIHELDDAFNAVKELLSPSGIFVFEDPSLLRILERGSYDQIYDEHPHVFSVIAINNLLRRNGLQIFRVDNLSVHGGSNRIYACHMDSCMVGDSVRHNINEEMMFGLDQFETYQTFAERVKNSKETLVRSLSNLKHNGKEIMCIGATAKSTTVFNYCGIGPDLIDVITDTTKAKQGMFSPGVHIPVVPRDSINLNDYDYAYLGAWNFKEVIADKEREFVQNGGEFITHVPQVMRFS